MDEELKKLLRDTLERNRAFVAGMAFGVPAESALEYTDAIVNDLVRVIKPLLEAPEVTPLSPSVAAKALMEASSDGGLEYAKLYGVYPDGRPYSSENVNWKQVIDPGGIFDAFAKDNDASDNVDQQHP
jgi:hypothetical protein